MCQTVFAYYLNPSSPLGQRAVPSNICSTFTTLKLCSCVILEVSKFLKAIFVFAKYDKKKTAEPLLSYLDVF